MSLPRYVEYKDSCVSWLSEVPIHWEARPLKYLAKLVTGLTPPTDVHENYAEEGFPWIRPEDINENGAVTHASKFLSEDGAEIARHLVPLSTLICCIGTIGKAGIIGAPAATNQQITAASFRGSAKYFYYATCAARTEIETSATGNVLKILNTERLGRIRFPDPPEDEQSAIAIFLDRETGKIDALIAEQEKLLTLLAEKRQATISHAVTRGLNPNAPMKDSGVPWLGEVPAHWEVLPIKRLGTIRYGIGEPPAYRDEGIPLIRATNVHAGIISRNGLVYVDPDDIPAQRILWLKPGDIIVVRSGAYTGDSALVTDEYAGCIAGFDMVLSVSHCAPEFMQYALLGHSLKICQIDLKRMRAAQPHLNAEELGECVIALPGMDEQSAISDFLAIETAKVDSLCFEAERGIELLNERRGALIAAAVTGKIDVRNAA